MKQLACIIISLLHSISSFGESSIKLENYLNINRSNGLCNNQVHCIQEDIYSRVWIGTFRGLEIYTPGGELSHNTRYGEETVTSLLNSGEEMIIGTNHRLEVYNYEKGQYETILYNNNNIPNVTSSTLIDSIIIFIDYSSIYTMVGNKVVSKRDKQAAYYKVIRDEYNYIWAISIDRVDKLDRNCNTIKSYYLPNSNETRKIGAIKSRSITISSNNQIWIGSEANGLFRYNRQTDSFIHVKSDLNPEIATLKNITSISEGNDNQLWLYSSRGIYIYDYIKDELKRYIIADYANIIVLCSYKLSSNKMIVGCFLKGVFIINELNPTFQFYRYRNLVGDEGNRVTVNNIQIDDQANLWVATDGHGVIVFDKNKSLIKSYSNINSDISRDIVSIQIDIDNNKWFGSASEGLYKLDIDNKVTTFLHDEADTTTLSGNSVHTLHQLSADTLIIATTKNIDIYSNGEFKRLLPENSTYYHQHTFSNENSIYFVHIHGVIVIDRHTLIPTYNTIYGRELGCGHLSYSGKLWLGTSRGELYALENGEFKLQLSSENKFDNHIVGINSDSHDQLWITTRSSLYSIDKNSTIYKYDLDWGLKDFEFLGRSTHKDHNGILYFGFEGAILAFNPKDISQVQLPDIKLYFSELLIDNKIVEPNKRVVGGLHKHINNIDTLIFSDATNNILLKVESISSRLNLINNSRIIYKLNGIDREYQELNPSSKQIILNNLPHGKYRLYVKAVDNNGEELDFRTILITIQPQLLHSTPMLALYLITTLIALYISIYFVRKYIKNNQHIAEEKKRQEDAVKIKAMKVEYFSHIASDFKTPLTIMSMLHRDLNISAETDLIYKRSLNQLEFSVKRVCSFIDLITDDKVCVGRYNIAEHIKGLYNIFKPLYNHKQIDHSLNMDMSELFMLIDINKIELMLSSLISKNIKELPIESKCDISVFTESDNLIITILNSGLPLVDDMNNTLPNHNRGLVGVVDTEIITFIAESLNIEMRVENINNREQKTYIIIPIELGDGDEPARSNIEFTSANTIADSTLLVDLVDDTIVPMESNVDTSNRYNILIIDDNYDILRVIKKQLSSNYKVVITASQEEAFHILQSHNIDIVVCDNLISERGEVCRRIKTDIALLNIPVIIMAENTSSESKIAILESGANVVISKPIALDELNLHINNLLRHKHSLRSYYKSVFNSNIPINEINNSDEIFIMELKQYIIDNLSDTKLTIGSLANHAKVSRTQLYLKVKSITKLFPSQFILNIKMEAAKKLLLESNISSAEISHKLGYCNPSHFTRQFKMFYNISPKEFRKNR